MLADIRHEALLTRHYTGRESLSPRVLSALSQVPRDAFVPPDLVADAYANGPLPIGQGQTISQPFIVALMSDLIAPEADHRVLEIGTGSGYQTAVLSRLCDTVYSIERLPRLADTAALRLGELGYDNVAMRLGDGCLGWPEHAPFDGILVGAAARRVPGALIEQLKAGGRMAIPVGDPGGLQELALIEKAMDGGVRRQRLLGVAFVPLIDRGSGVA